jgi:hypothetical protein
MVFSRGNATVKNTTLSLNEVARDFALPYFTIRFVRYPGQIDAQYRRTRPGDDFYLKLKTKSMVRVQVQYQAGFKVFLQGEKKNPGEGAWIQKLVGRPGKP